MKLEYEKNYNDKLKIGLEYQDFVAEKLYSVGLPIFNYASRKYQLEHGENKLGIEIKYDMKFSSTGNLWIEVSEKSNPNNANYYKSGIYRSDNTWLFAIGNYEIIFIFAKNMLQKIHKSEKYRTFENNTRTSMGFLLPRIDAEEYAVKTIIC